MRLLDTGRRSAAENIALDWVLLRKRAEGKIPDTFRLLQFTPSVLIGYHQCPKSEVRLSYCRKKGIQVCRRITGGGTIYFDSSQIGWEVIASRERFPKNLHLLTKRLAEGVVIALGKMGIEASFRGRNDVEVEGRKISGMGGVYEDGAFLLQGTLLVDFDVEGMLQALRVPIEKLKKREIDSLKDRVTWISKELGYKPSIEWIKLCLKKGFEEALDEEFEEGSLLQEEIEAFENARSYFSSKSWLYKITEPKSSGTLSFSSLFRRGKLSVHLSVDLRRRLIKSALFIGDVICAEPKDLYNLEAAMKDVYFVDAESVVEEFFKKRRIQGLKKEDVKVLLKKAMERADYAQIVGRGNVNAVYVLNGSLKDVLKAAEYLLLPYCAKPLSCSLRKKDGCKECGGCSVGQAYRMAKEVGIVPISINSFHHLKSTLNKLREKDAKAYIACCCHPFFVRRESLFKRVGIPAVFVDIKSRTCFSLNKEKEALEGEFEGETKLRLNILEKLLKYAKS